MKKLRQNQEFLMSNTLRPHAPVWTKWHQERAQNSIMEKDLTRAPNQKYITVRVRALSVLRRSLVYISLEYFSLLATARNKS